VESERLSRVLQQLRLYDHPLLAFDARAKGDGVEVIIRPKFTEPRVHTYYFEWAFQRQLFDCLHDYLIEMFLRTPQHRHEHQQMEREGQL